MAWVCYAAGTGKYNTHTHTVILSQDLPITPARPTDEFRPQTSSVCFVVGASSVLGVWSSGDGHVLSAWVLCLACGFPCCQQMPPLSWTPLQVLAHLPPGPRAGGTSATRNQDRLDGAVWRRRHAPGRHGGGREHGRLHLPCEFPLSGLRREFRGHGLRGLGRLFLGGMRLAGHRNATDGVAHCAPQQFVNL